jgi:hypothetical protein
MPSPIEAENRGMKPKNEGILLAMCTHTVKTSLYFVIIQRNKIKFSVQLRNVE